MKYLAHEAYVLTHTEVEQALSMTSPNPFTALAAEGGRFALWGLGIGTIAILIFFISFNPSFERVCGPFLMRLKKYAPFIGRMTLGAALLASGYYHAAFGPELPMSGNVSLVLMFGGLFIMIGFLSRLVAALGILFFVVLISQYQVYMLTYLNYVGEMILVLILGGGTWSIDRVAPIIKGVESRLQAVAKRWERYSFLILRLCFGAAIFFASFYAKFLHSNMALETVADYHLTHYFPFTPLFLVLGAFIVEAIIGICFFIGLGVRFAALVFIFFLILSILFFGEAVWPHIILFGVNLALFTHGYDKYTVGALLQGRREGEPVL